MIKKNFMKLNILITLIIFYNAVFTTQAIPQVDYETTEYTGMCDASAAVAIGSTMFIVANDEDNVLRVYQRDKPGNPIYTYNLNSFLKMNSKHQETDIEGATKIGDYVYWITSHGTNKKGKSRPTRRQLFATEVKVVGDKINITPIGKPYRDLIQTFDETPLLSDYKLSKAAKKTPEQFGGLNIEGLCATPQGTLLIAFRNPIPDKKALLIPLENPNEIIHSKFARLGKPILLDLGGLGIRSIEYCETIKKYLIIAGSYNNKSNFRLYKWSGISTEEPEHIKRIDFKDLHPEALIVYPKETKVQILSDDGTKRVDGQECKELDKEMRSFRSIWVNP
jgi:IMP cyclohydrolase